MKDGPREKPLGLDMSFDEALARFVQTDPKELPGKFAKKRGPPKRPKAVDEEAPVKAPAKPLD